MSVCVCLYVKFSHISSYMKEVYFNKFIENEMPTV